MGKITPRGFGAFGVLLFMNRLLFTRQPPTSRRPASEMRITGIGTKAEHWAQGYHRERGESSRIQNLIGHRLGDFLFYISPQKQQVPNQPQSRAKQQSPAEPDVGGEPRSKQRRHNRGQKLQ